MSGTLLRVGTALVLAVALSIPLGCRTQSFSRTPYEMETDFVLDSANFETAAVHAVGRARCFYVLLGIPLCRRPDLATVAWAEMRRQANLDGRSGQLVNVTEDYALRWNLAYLFYEEIYTVSADAIAYE